MMEVQALGMSSLCEFESANTITKAASESGIRNLICVAIDVIKKVSARKSGIRLKLP